MRLLISFLLILSLSNSVLAQPSNETTERFLGIVPPISIPACVVVDFNVEVRLPKMI